MSKRALIVVDIQNDYFPGGRWTLDGMEQAGSNAAAVIGAARAAGDRVIFIAHEFESADAPFLRPRHRRAKLHAVLGAGPADTVIVKHEVNAFKGTELNAVLQRDGIEDVTIVGAMSHMCIDAATRAAADLGYKVTLVHDACATRDLEFAGRIVPAAEAHAAFMSALGFAYATLVSTADYVRA